MRIHASRIPRSRVAFPDQLQGLGYLGTQSGSAIEAAAAAVRASNALRPKPTVAEAEAAKRSGKLLWAIPESNWIPPTKAWKPPAKWTGAFASEQERDEWANAGGPDYWAPQYSGDPRSGSTYISGYRYAGQMPPLTSALGIANRNAAIAWGRSVGLIPQKEKPWKDIAKVVGIVALGAVGIGVLGAALTGGAGAAATGAVATGGVATAGAVAPATAVAGTGAGMTVTAAAPAYAAQIAAAGSIVPAAATVGGGGLLSQAATYVIGAAKSAAISQVTGLVQSKSAEFLANQFAPDVQDDPFAGTTFDQASVSGTPKPASSGQAMPWILAAAAIGFFVLLDTEKGKRHVR
jgi:hypothetical protein